MSSSTTTANMPSGIYLSPTSLNFPHSHSPITTATPNPTFTDHYAVLGLDIWSTSEEIKAAYRRLRTEYFTPTTMDKYRALQDAFVVLADREARHSYDKVYRERKGLPAPPPFVPPGSSPAPAGFGSGSVRERVGILERRDSKDLLTLATTVSTSGQEVDVEVEVEGEKEEHEVKVQVVCTPLIGTRPYHSYIPILVVYEGSNMHPKLKCGRPKYVRDAAYNSLP